MGRTQIAFRAHQVLAALLLLTPAASAHPLKMTGVVVRIEDGRTTVTVTAHAPAPDLAGRLRLKLDGRPFAARRSSLMQQQDSVSYTAAEEGEPTAVLLEAPLYPEVPDNTTVMLVYRNGRLADRAVLGENLLSVIARFVRMGVLHILSGPDHVLFVLGLIMMRGHWRRLLAVITSFTVAHSITLTLTALGIAGLSPRIVEPAIALSIVAVGLENLLNRAADLQVRMGLAFGFGLFHGFGFAGALSEAGLPAQEQAWSLVAFNVGVELGQLCIVAVALSIPARSSRRLTAFASAGIALAGAVWFLARI